MPLEKRDPGSKARLFIPTNRERSLVHSQRQLDKSLEEVESMKKELKKMIEQAKK
jgi:hypothetical protein